jgi:hypothetical protein
MAAWQDQSDLVKRYFRRIRDRNRERTDYEDDLLSFFQNCWHLKDWVYNDETLPTDVREAIKKAVHKSKPLLICRDLANRSKHLRLSNPSIGPGADIFGEAEIEVTPSIGENQNSNVLWDYVVDVDGEFIRALDVAEAALGAWHFQFVKHKMLR